MAKKIPVSLVITGVDRVGKVLDRVTKRFPKMARAVRRANLAFKIFQMKTEKLRRGLTKFGKGMRNVGKSMTTHLSLPIGLAGAGILRTAVNFQKSINRVGALSRTIIKGKVSQDFLDLEAKAKQLGSTTEFSASQAADAMSFLAQASLKPNEILASVSDVLALASASGSDLAFSARVAANTLRAFELPAEQMSRVSDVLSLTTARANVNLEEMADTLKFTAPIAKQYGATLEETAALTGLLGNVGMQGSVAGTALKNMFLRLSAPTSKVSRMLKTLNVEVEDGKGGMRGVADILKDLGMRMKKFPVSAKMKVLNELFGLRGIAGGAALMSKAISEGKNPINTFTEILNNSTGAAKDMQQTMLRGAPGAVKRFQSAFEGLALAIANSGLLEMFGSFLKWLTAIITKLSVANPMLLKIGTIVALIAAALGPLLVALGFMATALAKLTFLWAALKAVAVAVGTVLAGLSLPVVLIIAGIAALIAGSILLVKHWQVVKDFFIGMWDGIKNAFSSGINFISRVIKKIPGVGLLAGLFGGAQGATPKGSLGPAVGARQQQTQLGVQRTETTNNAQVQVDFANVPRGTKVQSKSTGALDFNLGFAGAIQ